MKSAKLTSIIWEVDLTAYSKTCSNVSKDFLFSSLVLADIIWSSPAVTDVNRHGYICDNGRSFDPEHTSPGHYGLSIMHERAQAIGAGLTVTRQPGHGAEIAIRWMEPPEEKIL